MQYQGGKSRIAKPLANIISEAAPREREFVSLFCGSCTVESKVTGFDRLVLNDKHKYLIDLLRGVQNGYELPDFVSEEQYKYIRQHMDEDCVLTGFVGFGCSFGGKWFGGYAKNKKNRNYALTSKTSLLRDMSTLDAAEFLCSDYRDVSLPEGCIIYADPPYANTTGYLNEKFDSEAFWKYAREVSKAHLMFISEQTAPDDFVSIWSKPISRIIDVNKQNYFKVTENLYVHKDNIQRLNFKSS